MNKRILDWRQSVGVRGYRESQAVPLEAPPQPRRTEEIALEVAANHAQRIEARDEEAAPLQVMLNKIIENALAKCVQRKEREEALAKAQAVKAKNKEVAEVKGREAEAEARRLDNKRKGGALPARGTLAGQSRHRGYAERCGHLVLRGVAGIFAIIVLQEAA